MKIILNKCFGGFALSHVAYLYLCGFESISWTYFSRDC